MLTNIAIPKPETMPEIITRPDALGLTDRQVANRVSKWAALDAEIKRLKAEQDALRAELTAGGRAVDIDGPGYVLKLTYYPEARFNSTAFKKAYPDIYEEFRQEATRSRFTARVK